MRVALVHDWLTGMRGGERCLAAFLNLYPNADIFTLLHLPGTTSKEIDRRVKEQSFLRTIPGIERYYRYFLPLFPSAIRTFDFKGYDLVISLSHAAAKNITVPPGTIHISYCFTPMRYIWDQTRHYFGAATPALWPIVQYLRNWDIEGSQSVDRFVAISRFVATRIRKFYGRDAEVIYPPVDTSWITPTLPGVQGAAFLYAGALVPYKRPELVVEAFNRLGEPLWIVGSGPAYRSLKKIAKSNIYFIGSVSDAELAILYRRSRALVFPGIEDFGMVPIECLAAGRPVIGAYDGALKETLNGVRPWDSSKLDYRGAAGVFCKRNRGVGQSAKEVEALIAGVRIFLLHEGEISPAECVRNAQRFSPARFYSGWRELVHPERAPSMRLPLTAAL